MNRKPLLTVLLIAAAAFAITSQDSFSKDKTYFTETGLLTEMQAVPCGSHAKGFTGIGGLLATAGLEDVHSHDKLCQEYVLRTDYMEYRIRPIDEKNPALLPVGEKSQFRVVKDHILLTVPDGDDKTREYLVVGMRPLKGDADSQPVAAPGPVQLQRRPAADDNSKPADDAQLPDPAPPRANLIQYNPTVPGRATTTLAALPASSQPAPPAPVAAPVSAGQADAAAPAPHAESDASANDPLSEAQVMGLVSGGVASSRVAALVEKRGIAFRPTPDFLADLKSVGAGDDLLNALAQARNAVPAHAAGSPNAAQPYRGGNPVQVRQLQAAEQQDRAAEMARPDDPNVHLELAQALGDEGKWSEAAAQYAAVISGDPNNAAAHNDLALALRKSGDIEGAIREYRRALAIDPGRAAFHDNLGVALSQKADSDGAMAEFRVAIRDDPHSGQAHGNLGTMLEERGDLDGAIREYRQALSLGGVADAQYNLATAFERKGDLNRAIAGFRQALIANPNDAKCRQGLAGALERSGDLAGALRQYAMALKLAPQDAALRARYDRLAAVESAANTSLAK